MGAVGARILPLLPAAKDFRFGAFVWHREHRERLATQALFLRRLGGGERAPCAGSLRRLPEPAGRALGPAKPSAPARAAQRPRNATTHTHKGRDARTRLTHTLFLRARAALLLGRVHRMEQHGRRPRRIATHQAILDNRLQQRELDGRRVEQLRAASSLLWL
jgi:hypothetical protein